MAQQRWPDTLWIIRHGESAGNVARDAAHAAGLPRITIEAARDMDVPLSRLGERQARALGTWFRGLPRETQPTVVLSSTYLRAASTAELMMEAAGFDPEKLCFVQDERLREREFGILDRLTRQGIELEHPEQARLRREIGKFYHRPPGGESWCDVILRLRSVIDTLSLQYPGERVVVVCHSVVVLCFRYLLEHLDEARILAIDRANEVANCSVTSYRFDPALDKHGRMALERFNFVAPLEEAGERVTREPNVEDSKGG